MCKDCLSALSDSSLIASSRFESSLMYMWGMQCIMHPKLGDLLATMTIENRRHRAVPFSLCFGKKISTSCYLICRLPKSRRCTGHLQVFFSKRNPLMCSQLRPHMRIIYSLGAYSYMCAAFLTPLFLLAPVLAIWIGVFPLDLNARIPAAFAFYYGMTLLTLYYSRNAKHLAYLWFVSTANLILWYTYARAMFGVIISHLSCGRLKITFQVSVKSRHLILCILGI